MINLPQVSVKINIPPKLKKIVSSKYAKGLLILLCLSFLILFSQSKFVQISDIDCKNQYGNCLEEEIAYLNEYKGQNIFLLNPKDVESKIRQSYLNRKVTIHKIFPNTLKVLIEQRKAFIALKPENSENALLLVDQDGVVLDLTEESSLPIIDYKKKVTGLGIGNRLPEEVAKAVKIYYLVYKSWTILSSEISEKELIIRLSEGPEVHFDFERDPQVVVGALQLIMSQSRIDGKLPNLIDLRFEKPVVRYE